MKRIKKIIKVLAFICFIALACVGIGMSGGVPIPTSGSKRDKEEANTEQVESKKEDKKIKKGIKS